eukprot:TRINITY_DN7319_c0_g1_i1.p1 TRINITY_DN7319_c0_g1~~TRINITY_DN7319_c0_g1_i1.p1  ORF type:complete len:224 (+),score=55.22 TRINITY_DN7319_c0_g1_i1:94-765(+)
MSRLSTETMDRLEKMGSFLTGSVKLNQFYGYMVSRSLRNYKSSKFSANEVIPRVYLGDVYAAHNITELKKRNITHIVSVVLAVPPAFPNDFKYLHLPLLDNAAEDIHHHFTATHDFISEAVSSGGSVLIHCLRGISRSATITAAYVMQSRHLCPSKAVDLLRQTRPIVKPNYGFMEQLEQFQKILLVKRNQSTTNDDDGSSSSTTTMKKDEEDDDDDGANPRL